MFEKTDEQLVQSVLQGHKRSWLNLVKRFESPVYNYSLRMTGNADDAMDLMQEVFLGVYRNLHRFRGDAKFSSWLFRIAHNKAVDLNRRKQLLRVQRSGDDEVDELERLPADRQFEPERRLSEEELNNQIVAMLASLPLEQRLIVEMKVFQTMTFEEIAQLQDISVNTAKTRFYTALRKLKVVSEENHVVS